MISEDGTDPLESLRRLIVRFIGVQARRPEIAGLMNIESSIDGPRLRYLFDRYMGAWAAVADRLTAELAAAGRIRALPPGALIFLLAYGQPGWRLTHPSRRWPASPTRPIRQ